MTIQSAINLLNSPPPQMLVIQNSMLLAHVQRAAKLGDIDAQRFVELCELNVEISTKH
jgi:hypothetical protein